MGIEGLGGGGGVSVCCEKRVLIHHYSIIHSAGGLVSLYDMRLTTPAGLSASNPPYSPKRRSLNQ